MPASRHTCRSDIPPVATTCPIQKYWEIWSVALAPSVQEVKNEKRLRLKKSIMKLLNYQISCYGVLPSVGGTNFRPKLYVYLIVSFSSSSFLSTYHPPIYFPGCSILAPRFPNTSEFDKYRHPSLCPPDRAPQKLGRQVSIQPRSLDRFPRAHRGRNSSNYEGNTVALAHVSSCALYSPRTIRPTAKFTQSQSLCCIEMIGQRGRSTAWPVN